MKGCLVFGLLFLFIVIIEAQLSQCGVGNAYDVFRHELNPLPRITTRIIGGNTLAPGDLPWVVLLTLDLPTKPRCTGAIISPNYVITAKHCTVIPDLQRITIGYGSSEIAEMKTVTSSTFLQSSGKNTYAEDIALLKLDSPIQFDGNVSSVCLSRSKKPELRQKALIAGFGLVFGSISNPVNPGDIVKKDDMIAYTPSVLNAVVIDVLNLSKCQSPNNDDESDPNNFFELCAGGTLRGTLRGDSGGPLMVYDDKEHLWFQVGITSRGSTIAGLNQYTVIDHGVYTDIAKFCDWIENWTNNEVKCSD